MRKKCIPELRKYGNVKADTSVVFRDSNHSNMKTNPKKFFQLITKQFNKSTASLQDLQVIACLIKNDHTFLILYLNIDHELLII